MGLRARLVGFLRAQDGALCALFGGYWWESISGTAGRACDAHLWWGRPLRALIEVQPWFGKGHCAAQVEEEARVRSVMVEARS